MYLSDSFVCVYHKGIDYMIPMGELTREEMRVEVGKILPARQCDLTFFRTKEYFFSENAQWFSDLTHFKNSLNV